MKILLVDPPFQRFMSFHRYYYPMGLASMAAVLKAKHEVIVYDAEKLCTGETLSWSAVAQRHSDYLAALQDDENLVWREIEDVVRQQAPDLVGITALSVKSASAVKVSRICKSINPDIKVVVGADHPSVFPEQFLAEESIDFAVRGEGEVTMDELVDWLERNDGSSAAMIPGVSCREGGQFRHGPERELIEDLDTLPLADIQSILNVETYRPVDFGAIIGSRGCPYSCSFCGVYTVWGKRVRYRSPRLIVDEIEMLTKRYGTTYFSFRDASFTLRYDRVIEICQHIIDRKLNVTWECLTRVDLLEDEILALMVQAGCISIRVGVESGCQRILDDMGKTVSLEDVKRAADLLNRHGIYWSSYILVGTPGETAESIQETMDFIAEIDPPFVTLARFAPIPGTAMYAELEKLDMIHPEIDWSMECNQRLSSHYVYNMLPDDFEKELARISEFVEVRNNNNSHRLGLRDQRLK